MSHGSRDADRWPAWATEPVTLVEHDPAWAERAGVFADEVRDVFAGWLNSEVVHVGSTAVPGLPAKPVIDLQAVSLEPSSATEATASAAQAKRWMLVPRELDRRPWRWLFVRVDQRGRSRLAHLHLMGADAARWDAQVRFRDVLRGDSGLRAEYAALKRRLAAAHRDDREAYSAAKAEFVRRVVGG